MRRNCIFSASDYQYMMMPEKDGDTYKIKLIHQDGEQEGICFTTADQGKTWTFAGAFQTMIIMANRKYIFDRI